MYIESFSYTIGIYPERHIDFSGEMNLIYSKQNTQGKTALIRMLLFAMGYQIPNSKGLELNSMQFCLCVVRDESRICVHRSFQEKSSEDLIVHINDELIFRGNFKLSRKELQKIITGQTDENLLENLLGVFYIDQEKGWTMLNRGKVIGAIQFNIENFLCAVGDKQIDEYKREISEINRHIQEYRKLLSAVSIAEDTRAIQGAEVTESVDEIAYKVLREYNVEIDHLKQELLSLKNIKQDNHRFLRYIEKFSLSVKASTGEIIPVNAATLLDFKQNLEYLQSRIDVLQRQLSILDDKKRRVLEKIRARDNEFKHDELLANYRQRIQNVSLNSFRIQDAIESLMHRRLMIQRTIQQLSNNSWLYKLNTLIRNYMSRLNVKWQFAEGEDIATTNKLSQFSGSEMTKRVLAFRFAFLKLIEERYGLKLPIIMDSPYAKEFDRKNFLCMLNIVKSDFSSYQVIIASIYDSGFDDNYMRITLSGGAWEVQPACDYILRQRQSY